MHSSYAQHDYAAVFERLVLGLRPIRCVELGVLDGYSTMAIARQLKANDAEGQGRGHLHAYDLFENYQYRHSQMSDVQLRLFEAGLDAYVTLHPGDVWELKPEPNSVDLLHVDLSNTGDTFNRIMDTWHPALVQGGWLLFEGGSEERDRVEWMVTYAAAPIKPAIEKHPILNTCYVYGTYLDFPSLTTCLKKR